MMSGVVFPGCFLFPLFALLAAQTAGQAPQQRPGPALVEAQSLVDSGKLQGAEGAVRRYLEKNENSADAHYLLGYILFLQANPKSSLEEYTKGARYRAPGALDFEVMGCDYFLLEDYPAADQWLTRSVEMDSGDSRARFYLGRTKYNEKRFDEAVRAFTECLKLDAKNVKAADNLGLAYEGLGKTEDALAAYRNAVALDSGAASRSLGPYLNLGTLLAENARASEALPFLEQAAQLAPSDARARREIGKAYLALNRLEEAQRELKKAVALEPESAPTHFLLAQVDRRRRLAEDALVERDHYTALTGGHSAPDTPLAQARSLLNQGKFIEAEQVMHRYLEVHRTSAEGHFLLGYVLFKKQDAKASLEEYTEGAKYRIPGAAELEVVASDYVLLKDYPDADKWFTKAVEWNPTDVLGWYYLGRTKYNENRFEEAIRVFQQCLKLDPQNVKAEDNLGLSYEGLNRTEEAFAAYRTAIEWEANAVEKNSGPFLDLGSLLVETGRVEEGLPHLLEAVRLSPEDYRTHRQLGKAYTRLNQLDKARIELEKAVELAPQNAPVHFMLSQVYRKQGLMDKVKLETDRYAALTGTRSAPEN
jgi:tetratricopeptide (TPR) repeat protein